MLTNISKPKDITSIDQDEELYGYIYSIGNMFILSGSTNSSLGNSIIQEKIDKLYEDKRKDDKKLIEETLYSDYNFLETKI